MLMRRRGRSVAQLEARVEVGQLIAVICTLCCCCCCTVYICVVVRRRRRRRRRWRIGAIVGSIVGRAACRRDAAAHGRLQLHADVASGLDARLECVLVGGECDADAGRLRHVEHSLQVEVAESGVPHAARVAQQEQALVAGEHGESRVCGRDAGESDLAHVEAQIVVEAREKLRRRRRRRRCCIVCRRCGREERSIWRWCLGVASGRLRWRWRGQRGVLEAIDGLQDVIHLLDEDLCDKDELSYDVRVQIATQRRRADATLHVDEVQTAQRCRRRRRRWHEQASRAGRRCVRRTRWRGQTCRLVSSCVI